MSPMQPFLERYETACEMLAEGVRRGRHPYHLLVAATITPDGLPAARTVVLRRFDAEKRQLMFHTDRRSAKVDALEACPAIALMFYDSQSKIQLRFTAQAMIHSGDALAREQWAQTRAESKLCYSNPVGSGGVVSQAEACGMEGGEPITEPDRDAQAFAHFAVVNCQYSALDMVTLHHMGHERCLICWDAQDNLVGQWLAI